MPVRLRPLTEPASRIALEGLIDYAGLFPPAALGMATAVRNYAHYRASGAGWMLGRFVCASPALALFSEKADPLLPRDAGAIPWRISVTGSAHIVDDLAQMAAFNERHRVCFDECGAICDAYEVKATTTRDVQRIAAATPRELTTYIEVPLGDGIEELVAAIGESGRRAKMRTGGTQADAIPSAAHVVRFLRAIVTQQVVAKATAGLHHPIAGAYSLTYEPDAPVGRLFGFLTVLLAAAHIGHGGSDADAVRLLTESNPTAFEWNDLQIAWLGPDGPVTFDRSALQQVREQAIVSVGSCSFTEPVDESRALSWI
jgi:hypothetical protein